MGLDDFTSRDDTILSPEEIEELQKTEPDGEVGSWVEAEPGTPQWWDRQNKIVGPGKIKGESFDKIINIAADAGEGETEQYIKSSAFSDLEDCT